LGADHQEQGGYQSDQKSNRGSNFDVSFGLDKIPVIRVHGSRRSFQAQYFVSLHLEKGELHLRVDFSCTDSILVNGKGSVFCPGEQYLIDQTSAYMKWALAPSHVNDKG
jgi:hypothetical protein